jgi:alpha-tubulin suppressor-like RCC1 family protein
MWTETPRLGSKSGNIRERISMPKGEPKRVEAFDQLDVKLLRIGQRHSAVITKSGELYTFGNGNWGVLGHGNEDKVAFNKPKLVEKLASAGVKVKDV